ncbi:MAG: carboxypeptidase regulatory-like domain-containing protein [Gemmatimonadota bacterium]
MSFLLTGAFLTILFLAPAAALAQTVRGAVVTGSGEPVQGALTVLLDAQGRRVVATLSGPHGRFELTAPGPGRYRVSAERIGYATRATPFFDLAAGAVVERTVVASVKAIPLEAIRVTGTSRCRPQRDAPANVQQLWDEARKALTAVSLVENAPAVKFQLERWERDLDPATNTVVSAARQPAEVAGEYPFHSPPATELLAHGFVQAVGDTSIFYAPDAHVLLSDAFLVDYCFRAEAGDSGRVGLAFEPIPGTQPASGVEGTLWLDSATAELRTLQYSYRGMDYGVPSLLPGGPKREARPNGDMEFKRLSNGAWIVSAWWIRAPRFGTTGGTPVDHVVYVHESSGRVLSVRGLRQSLLAERPAGILRGRLLTEGGVPLPGALVYLSGTPYADTTDAEGAFAMTDVWAGKYDLAWYDREHDRRAEHVRVQPVEVRNGENEVEIRVAGLDSVLSGGCPPEGRRAGFGVIAGVVRERNTGVPLGGVRVQASGAQGRRQETTSDRNGRFRLCWLPAGTYALAAGVSRFGEGRTSVPVESERVTRSDLELAVAAEAARGHRPTPPRLTGRVVDAGTGKALAGVTVRLQGTKQSRVSDDAGRFVFDEVPAGHIVLQATRPGYADASGSVTVQTGQSLRLEIRMATQPIALEPIVVTAVRTRRLGLLADLQYRMKYEHGLFIQHDEIEKRNPRSLGQMIPITTRMQWEARQCSPALYIDGSRMSDAKGIDITPTSVEVMEIYTGPADVPAEFSGSTAGCGAVAIWTRRGLPPDTTGTDTLPGGGTSPRNQPGRVGHAHVGKQ